MATNPQIAFTNMENAARSGVFRCLVPWSTGDIANLATLQTSRQIEFNGVNRNVCWSTFGPTHRDGSIRWSVAEFEATIPAGATTRTAPDVIATVVEAANTQPTADFSEFDAYWADFEISLSYTDPRNSVTYSLNLLSVARAGTNNATYTETTVGLRKIIRAEAYFGRGTHYELERASGFDTNSAATLTAGNLHARLWFEVSSGQRWGHGVLQFVADAQYPSPSQPPDGGGRVSSDHGRWTRLDPAVGEELDDPLTFEFQNGITALFADANQTSSQYTSTRLWFVQNPTTGTSCWGDHPFIDQNPSRTVRIGLYGLGDMQGWPIRFTTAWECQTQGTWTEAREKALRPYTYIGLPTHDTWMDTVRTAYLPAPYSTDQVRIKGGWEIPLVEVPAATRSTWYSEGESRYQSLLAQNYGPLGWPRQYTVQGRSWEWQMLGRKVNPPGSGAAPQLGMFREGRMILANSVWDLMIHAAHTTRELGGPRQGMLWKHEDQPSSWDGTDLNATVYITGTDFHWSTRDGKGRTKGIDYDQNRSNYILSGTTYQGFGSWYNGDTAAWENHTFASSYQDPSDPNNRGALLRASQTWKPWDHAHFGMRNGTMHAILTQDPFVSDMVANTAYVQTGRFVPTHYHGRNPADSTLRAEARSLVRCAYHAWLVDGSAVWPERVRRRLTQYTGGTVGNSVTLHRWWEWPVMMDRFSPSLATATYRCDNTYSNRTPQNRLYVAWQGSHMAVFCLNAAIEWADLTPTGAGVMARLAHEAIRTNIEQCFCAGDQSGLSVDATRAIDACWARVITLRTGTQLSAIVNAQYVIGKLYRVAWTDTDPYGLYDEITLDTQDLDPSNGGQNENHHPLMLAYEIFADLRGTTGFTERAEYFADRLATWRGMTFQQYDENGTQGYTSDRWVPSGTFAPPTPQFTGVPRQGLIPLTVAFDATASQINGDRSAATLRWWFDWDGSSTVPDLVDTIANNPAIETPSYTYTGAGSYRVRLQITDSAGQTNSLDYTDYIVAEATPGSAPVAAFECVPTSGEVPLEIQCVDQSTGTVLTWLWTVTDGAGAVQTSTAQAPSFTIGNSGDADVSLLVTNAWGTGYNEKPDYISVTDPAQPVAGFTPTPLFGSVPPDLSVTFTNTSQNATGYQWDFGDGTGSTTTSPTHTYTTDGVYIVLLYAYNSVGDLSIASRRYTVASVEGGGAFPVDLVLYPEALQATALQWDVTPGAVADGIDVAITAQFAQAFSTDPDSAADLVTVTINPGADVSPDYLEATAVQFDPTAEYARDVTPDYQAATAVQFDPLVWVGTDVIVAEPPITIQFATAVQFAPTVTRGTGKTISLPALFTYARQWDPVDAIIYDIDITPDVLFASTGQWDPNSGRRSVDLLMAYQAPTSTIYDVSAIGNGIYADYQGATAVVFAASAEGNVSPSIDYIELYGSLEAPDELSGSV